MLARLNQVNGVVCSFANESGTLIRLSLRPGADLGRVAAEASRILREQAEDRLGVRLGGGETAAALQREQWRDEGRVSERSAPGTHTDETRAGETPAVETPAGQTRLLLGVLLGCAAVVLWLLWRRHRKAPAEQETPNPAPQPTRARLASLSLLCTRGSRASEEVEPLVQSKG